jgi:Sulfotransferase domain
MPLNADVPDFVIVGAPKCGTTSLCRLLRQHPGICMSYLKEPHFFADDVPGQREVVRIHDYRALFRPRTREQIWGEASTGYLFSSNAIPAMVRRRRDVRIIAVVRSQLDLVQSFHNQLVRTLDEDQTDIEQAWRLQELRRRGECVPRFCREPRFLDYKAVCSLGAQIHRLVSLVPPERRLILVLDDLALNPDAWVSRIFDFLGLSADKNVPFPQENGFGQRRSAILAAILRLAYVNPQLNRLRVLAKPVVNSLGLRPLEYLYDRNVRAVSKPPMRPEFRAELVSEFRADVELLGSCLGRSFEHWLPANLDQEPVSDNARLSRKRSG